MSSVELSKNKFVVFSLIQEACAKQMQTSELRIANTTIMR